jgi:hypothetical protein
MSVVADLLFCTGRPTLEERESKSWATSSSPLLEAEKNLPHPKEPEVSRKIEERGK